MSSVTSTIRHRLLLLLLLVSVIASAFPEDTVVAHPMPRARYVLLKRARAIESMTLTLERAQRVCDNSGTWLRGPGAPLLLPCRSHLRVSVPHPSETLPRVSVRLGDAPLQTLWEAGGTVLVIVAPASIHSGVLRVRLDDRLLWERKAYVTYAVPLSPQNPAWVGILDDATRWAQGGCTPEEIVARLTVGLFESGRFRYPVDDLHKKARYVSQGRFALRRFLAQPAPAVGNCVDVSAYLSLCAHALGISLQVAQVTDSQERMVVTQPVCPIGWDPRHAESFQALECEMHQLNYLPGAHRLYDACFLARTYTWSADALQDMWQPLDGSPGLVARPSDSVPQALVSRRVPSVY